MKIFMVTVLGLGLWMLGKKMVGNRFSPQTVAPSGARDHSEDRVIQVEAITPPAIH